MQKYIDYAAMPCLIRAPSYVTLLQSWGEFNPTDQYMPQSTAQDPQQEDSIRLR